MGRRSRVESAVDMVIFDGIIKFTWSSGTEISGNCQADQEGETLFEIDYIRDEI